MLETCLAHLLCSLLFGSWLLWLLLGLHRSFSVLLWCFCNTLDKPFGQFLLLIFQQCRKRAGETPVQEENEEGCTLQIGSETEEIILLKSLLKIFGGAIHFWRRWWRNHTHALSFLGHMAANIDSGLAGWGRMKRRLKNSGERKH